MLSSADRGGWAGGGQTAESHLQRLFQVLSEDRKYPHGSGMRRENNYFEITQIFCSSNRPALRKLFTRVTLIGFYQGLIYSVKVNR